MKKQSLDHKKILESIDGLVVVDREGKILFMEDALARSCYVNGKPLDYGAEQRITVAEAIHCYTLESAFAVGRDHELGTLEPGKYADMAVLDRNILKVDPEQIKETRVKYTIMNGRVTYEG